MSENEPTEWVTVKVPKADREQANVYKPDSATWGDCLVAGAKALAKPSADDESIPRSVAQSDDVMVTTEPTDALIDALRDELDAPTDTLTYDDAKNAAAAAIREEFPDEVLRG